MRKVIVAVFCLAISAAGMFAQETGEGAWILGVSGVSAAGLTPLDQTALSFLPGLVLDRIRDLDRRFVPDEEIRMRREKERLSEKYAAGAESAALRDKRDDAALSPSPTQKRAAEERQRDSDYRKGRKEQADSDEKATGPQGMVRISLWAGHSSGKFVEDSQDPVFACIKEKLDYLIRWDIREMDGFFRIRMEGWNAVLGRSDFVHTAYCPKDDIASVADELAYAVVFAASSRPSALIVFHVDPPDTRVFVDGRLMASGKNSFRVYEERDYEVIAKARGYAQAGRTIRPEFGTVLDITLELTPVEEIEATVATEPSGASLYLDGIWTGTTPVSFRVYGVPRVAVLQYPGYENLFALVGPGEKTNVTLALEKIGEGSSSRLTRRKEKFYDALGFFVVSLPVSIVSYGAYLQSYMLYLEDPGNSDFSRRNAVRLGWFASAVGVSGALFVNAAIQLVRYVKSAR